MLDDLKAAGDAFVQELMRTFDQLILGAPATADSLDGLATSYKGWLDDLGCELDPSAFHAPFSDSLVSKQFDIELMSPAAQAWLVRAETGLKVPVELHPSGEGSAGVAPALGPGMWALVAQDTAGHSRCILLRAKSASFSGPDCAPGPTGSRGCEALELVMDRRYADLRALGAELPASDTETRLILAAAACQQGHLPGDLITGDVRDCASVYRALHR